MRNRTPDSSEMTIGDLLQTMIDDHRTLQPLLDRIFWLMVLRDQTRILKAMEQSLTDPGSPAFEVLNEVLVLLQSHQSVPNIIEQLGDKTQIIIDEPGQPHLSGHHEIMWRVLLNLLTEPALTGIKLPTDVSLLPTALLGNPNGQPLQLAAGSETEPTVGMTETYANAFDTWVLNLDTSTVFVQGKSIPVISRTELGFWLKPECNVQVYLSAKAHEFGQTFGRDDLVSNYHKNKKIRSFVSVESARQFFLTHLVTHPQFEDHGILQGN